jgi:hypothetical protein
LVHLLEHQQHQQNLMVAVGAFESLNASLSYIPAPNMVAARRLSMIAAAFTKHALQALRFLTGQKLKALLRPFPLSTARTSIALRVRAPATPGLETSSRRTGGEKGQFISAFGDSRRVEHHR